MKEKSVDIHVRGFSDFNGQHGNPFYIYIYKYISTHIYIYIYICILRWTQNIHIFSFRLRDADTAWFFPWHLEGSQKLRVSQRRVLHGADERLRTWRRMAESGAADGGAVNDPRGPKVTQGDPSS